MRFQTYLDKAGSLIMNYSGGMPLSNYLKHYFASHREHGSRDRKWIAHLCYCYFRLGHSLRGLGLRDRLTAAVNLCGNRIDDPESPFEKQGLVSAMDHGKEGMDRFQRIYPEFSPGEIFPWPEELSQGMDFLSYTGSFLSQPDLFIRLRPGHESSVKTKLTKTSIPFRELSPSCLAMDNATKLEGILDLNREAVIQDFSSQRVGGFFELPENSGNSLPRIWDCCCGSGGKSILATDLLSPFDLTVSDNRKSILQNLRIRFREAGINSYISRVLDLAKIRPPGKRPVRGKGKMFPPSDPEDLGSFDLILADLPCSGSGTWSRNPEELFFFDRKRIGYYAELQRKILYNLIPYLKSGGILVYMTCSVFQRENEEISSYIEKELKLRRLKQGLITGYEQRADSMFAAAFQL
jgi:16S rRNA (cytosine967-C5)-methyltransferase